MTDLSSLYPGSTRTTEDTEGHGDHGGGGEKSCSSSASSPCSPCLLRDLRGYLCAGRAYDACAPAVAPSISPSSSSAMEADWIASRSIPRLRPMSASLRLTSRRLVLPKLRTFSRSAS